VRISARAIVLSHEQGEPERVAQIAACHLAEREPTSEISDQGSEPWLVEVPVRDAVQRLAHSPQSLDRTTPASSTTHS
jgi:hypothetical protein